MASGTSHIEKNDTADLQMNRTQRDHNQTRHPVMTSQEVTTLGELCLKVMVTLLGRPSWVYKSGMEHHNGYTHGVLVHKGGCCGPHFFIQKDPLLTCPGTCKSRYRMQACSCPSEGLVPASIHGAERDCSGSRRYWRETDISASPPVVILDR